MRKKETEKEYGKGRPGNKALSCRCHHVASYPRAQRERHERKDTSHITGGAQNARSRMNKHQATERARTLQRRIRIYNVHGRRTAIVADLVLALSLNRGLRCSTPYPAQKPARRSTLTRRHDVWHCRARRKSCFLAHRGSCCHGHGHRRSALGFAPASCG